MTIVQGQLSSEQVRAMRAWGGVTLTVDTAQLQATLTPSRFDRQPVEIKLVVVQEDTP